MSFPKLNASEVVMSTAVLAGVGGYLLNLSSGLLQSLWYRILSYFICSVEIRSEDFLFLATLRWLDELPQSKRFRMMHAAIDGVAAPDPSLKIQHVPKDARVLFSLGLGTHILLWNWRLVWVMRARDQQPTMDKSVKENIYIKMLSRDPSRLRLLIEEILNGSRAEEEADGVQVMALGQWGMWSMVQRRSPRPLGTVILPEGDAERLLHDCQWFLENQEFYIRTGLPYRRGYLLEGVPGSGKSSLIFAIAGVLKRDIWCLALSQIASDQALHSIISKVKEGDFLVMEDIDCLFDGREKKDDDKTSRLSFSGFLNALDGLASKEGLVVFMTTNHKEKLDPALIRPGRVDFQMHFGHATEDQARRIFRRFFPEALSVEEDAFARWATAEPRAMAALQQELTGRSGAHLEQPAETVEP